MPAGPATGGTIALPGADFLDYDPDADRVSRVVGYFDTATTLAQLGLQVHISPADMAPITKFGISLRVDTERETLPGAFSITWIDIDPEYQVTLIDATTNIVMEQYGNDGYLGSPAAGGAMLAATDFSLTTQPRSRSSAWTLGLPGVPPGRRRLRHLGVERRPPLWRFVVGRSRHL